MFDSVDDFLKHCDSQEEKQKIAEIQRDAHAICAMILNEKCPEVDIEIAKGKLRDKAAQYFPDKMDLYKMIYEARFKRLWEQFRS